MKREREGGGGGGGREREGEGGRRREEIGPRKEKGLVSAGHDRSDGGLVVTLIEMVCEERERERGREGEGGGEKKRRGERTKGREGLVSAGHDRSDGGLVVTLIEMVCEEREREGEGGRGREREGEGGRGREREGEGGRRREEIGPREEKGLVSAGHDRSDGGLVVTLIEMVCEERGRGREGEGGGGK